jgi:hemoglobin
VTVAHVVTRATLYERLGGRDAIETVVDEFYDRVLADPQLAPYFEDVDMASQRAHQTAFIVAVTGGPAEYDGDDMREAHAHLDLSESDFEAVAGHLDDALAECGVADEDRETVISEVASLKPAVLGR